MRRLVLSNPFVAVVAPILLGVLAHKVLSKRRASALRDADDQHPGTPSPPIQPSENDYDVFLNFRGRDTRERFVDHLYCGLVNAGICVFRDDAELLKGEDLSSNLQEALENSKIFIPIISENYASSKWCLDELPKRWLCTNGSKLLEKSVPYEDGKLLMGRSEGELVELVVHKVLKELKKAVEFVVSDYLVGIDSSVEEVMELVNKNASATLRVGIYGIGGIGKMTLAKIIYNKLSNQFVHRSFIADIRESCNCNGINYLQNQLIFDMQKEKIQFCNSDEGIKYISSRLKDKKVLIILDDVDTANQLEALVGNPVWFASGSRIFVTARNESVLDRTGVDIKYEHKQMDEEQSLILFSRHAFQRDYPPSEILALSRCVLSTTGGIPLAIEVAVQARSRIIDVEVKEDRRNVEDANLATYGPSILPSENDYEVFLSFRGVDTRRDFTDYLYNSLIDAGIRVLRDDDELPVGERLSEELMQVIRNINILIPIISVNYASSKWCLDELQEMLRAPSVPYILPSGTCGCPRSKGSFWRSISLFRKVFRSRVYGGMEASADRSQLLTRMAVC
ncbi:disease resistance protein RUN1-like [Eucalyptus grandis]|uniref:disease resistance protein RUN1-like n=1 Tax=Eucalyptus grandis TaxID=71139 RepID=UPI00192ED835|nr:disease resistance protein RUN1-like [Eucalyptus grandis]